MDCWRSTVRNHGCLALYAGMVPNLVGEVVYRGLKYCLYDFIQVRLRYRIEEFVLIQYGILKLLAAIGYR